MRGNRLQRKFRAASASFAQRAQVSRSEAQPSEDHWAAERRPLGSRAKTRRLGFTLIEIMAVVLIIGLLSTLVGLAIFPQIDKARVSTARTQLSMLDQALEAYRMDNADFPTSEQGLVALVNPPPEARNAQPGGYLRERRVPVDPWGRPFQYEMPGQHNTHSYDLWSFGKDGSPGGEGTNADIGNWVEGAQEQAG